MSCQETENFYLNLNHTHCFHWNPPFPSPWFSCWLPTKGTLTKARFLGSGLESPVDLQEVGYVGRSLGHPTIELWETQFALPCLCVCLSAWVRYMTAKSDRWYCYEVQSSTAIIRCQFKDHEHWTPPQPKNISQINTPFLSYLDQSFYCSNAKLIHPWSF